MGKRAFPPLHTRPQLVAVYPALFSTFAILRFGEGIRQAEADRHERDERAREEAAERLKYLFVDANNNNIKGKDRNETTFQQARPTF